MTAAERQKQVLQTSQALIDFLRKQSTPIEPRVLIRKFVSEAGVDAQTAEMALATLLNGGKLKTDHDFNLTLEAA